MQVLKQVIVSRLNYTHPNGYIHKADNFVNMPKDLTVKFLSRGYTGNPHNIQSTEVVGSASNFTVEGDYLKCDVKVNTEQDYSNMFFKLGYIANVVNDTSPWEFAGDIKITHIYCDTDNAWKI